MITIGAERTAELLPFDRLVPALRAGFQSAVTVPERQQHRVGPDGGSTMLIMPAFGPEHSGVKIATVYPDQRPAVAATYTLFDNHTGQPLAHLDGTTITSRRTAAASALAADFLARADARTLLIIGSGTVAAMLPAAYRAVRPIDRVLVHSRTAANAAALAERVGGEVVTDLPAAVAAADVVSCATLATEPVVLGQWLRPGVHLDLIGSFRPDMRETDDAAIARSSVFVDTFGACEESGDLSQPLANGTLRLADIRADLTALCTAAHLGRTSPAELTLFKSAGTAVEDLAAAVLAYRSR
ncbi:ornithine cyclodeaminase family protein [Kutzneria albida]|uniref:Ornithine cyclodeaminase n=1 Tax=Kutzneria albida DSM 43870 TaxID=1449976 RepID=W5WGR5_9PSEU|nr:ornithine cyclodeaminase family protein [Kutzneria albida]AHH99771.1 hypothetical protein KALB_6412 [Kutzneria albida DSM 43870]